MNNPVKTDIDKAYAHCLNVVHSHYENFPVASWLLPKALRAPIAAIYAFARRADDFADEGDLDNATRLDKLAEMGRKLDACQAGNICDDPVFIAVNDSILEHALPTSLFHDLLSAFSQDVTKKRYANFDEVLDYCRRSANPVGRLLLHLFNEASKQNLNWSDSICSALQLINFFQDVQQDYHEQGRIYIPQDDMKKLQVTEEDINQARHSPEVSALLRFEAQRAKNMMLSGKPLGRSLKGRAGFEIRAIIAGGLRVADALLKQPDPFSRPRLSGFDRLGIVWHAAIFA